MGLGSILTVSGAVANDAHFPASSFPFVLTFPYPLDGGTAGQFLCVSSSASFYHSSLKIAVYPLSIGDTLILLTVRVLGISTIIPVFISLV